jgi:tetratricopeptide (TPR) repeat protein
MIKNELDKDKGLATKLAQVAGLANPSPLYKFLNEPDREMNDFKGLLEIVRYLFMDREKEIMHDYTLTLDPNGKCARISLEYSLSNRMYDITDTLIAKLSQSKNTDSREWALIYGIDRKVDKGEITLLESIDVIAEQRIKSKEMQSFGKMLQFYAYFKSRMFDMMFQISTGLEEKIKKINDNYIRFSYLCRLGLVMANVNLFSNNIDDARKYGRMVLDNTTQDSLRSVTYLQLGNAHIMENYEVSKDYLTQAYITCKNIENGKLRLIQVKRSLNFLNNYWGVKPEHLDFDSTEVSDVHEVAFYYIRSEQYEKAKVVLDGISNINMNDYQKGFHFFYRGLMSSEMDDFRNSVYHFKKSGDKYYRNLSLIELEKLGENPMVLKNFSI